MKPHPNLSSVRHLQVTKKSGTREDAALITY